jgi:hypothetical protein
MSRIGAGDGPEASAYRIAVAPRAKPHGTHPNVSACASEAAAASFGLSLGTRPSTGHSIPTTGSSQATVRSAAAFHGAVVLYATSAHSLSAKNPWPKPGGIHTCSLPSSVSSTPTQRPNEGDDRLRSTATSNTLPRTARTSFPCA